MGLRRALACAALCALLGACATSGPATTGGVEMPPRAKSRRALARKLRPVALRGRWVQTNDGETLDDVAKRTGAPILDLEELNGLPRDRALAANSRVFVPRAAPLPPRQRRAARRASSSSAPARASSRSRSRSRSRASAPTPTPPSPSTPAPRPLGKGAPASGGMLWPVAGGTLSSRFGPRGGRPHEGIDIAAPAGSAVRAAAAGVVIYAGAGIRGYGNLVIVRHRRLVTVYAHNRKNLVRRGTRVARGDVVAEVGSSGRATGNHLHFEVRVGETPRDPLRYVQPAGGAAK